jgi:hypothetical protein
MPALPAALLMLAQPAEAAASAPANASPSVYGPAPEAPPKPAPINTAERQCAPQNPDPNSNQIVVCAVKPEGYRLPPDVVEARRLKKQDQRGRPHNPHETYADHSCATVGPMGCRGAPTIDFIAVAATAAEISKRLAKGQEIGSIFQTTPSQSEYQFYQEAKKEREEKEAEKAAKAVADAARAKAEAKTRSTPSDPTQTNATSH